MARAAVTPELEKERRRKWILLIVMLLSLAVMITSLIFLARIRGWRVRRSEKSLLTIVSASSPVSADSDQTLSFVDDDFMIDERCAAQLEQMLHDCRAAGHKPKILAAYRSASEQRELFNALTEDLVADGHDFDTARELAALQVDPPGESEHQLGLAVDIADEEDHKPGGTQLWLDAHAWEYGFILRYPAGKENITGKNFVPDHYRYVGTDAAKQIHELDITLEEYVAMFYGN